MVSPSREVVLKGISRQMCQVQEHSLILAWGRVVVRLRLFILRRLRKSTLKSIPWAELLLMMRVSNPLLSHSWERECF